MASAVSSAKEQVKCIFATFLLFLLSRVFTVAIFHIIFYFMFQIILTQTHENEPKLKLKMSQKWLKDVYCEQPPLIFIFKSFSDFIL